MDTFIPLLLSFAHYYVISSIIIVGFTTVNANIFGRAAIFLFFTQVYNLWLKSIFQMPLPPEMHAGYAFPSGHMHSMLVFYGWLAIELRNKYFTGFVIFAILAQAYGMLYQQYHYPIDIIGAWLFGGVSLSILYYLHRQVEWIKQYPYFFGLLLSFISLIIIAIMPPGTSAIRHVWQAHGCLIGLVMGWMLAKDEIKSILQQPLIVKINSLVTLLAFLGIFYTIFSKVNHNGNYKIYLFTGYFISCFMLASWPLLFLSAKKILAKDS